jgi:hypothetical protein
LARERLGRILDGVAEDDVPGEQFELALEVTHQERASAVVEAVLKAAAR